MILKLILSLCVLVSLTQTAANAQTIDGTLGWQSSHSGTDYYSSADGACHAQWQYYMGGHVDSRYIGYDPDVGNPSRVECRWTQYQYLCPQETGGGINSCWTIFPAFAELKCQSGYVPVQGKSCAKDAELFPERPPICNKCASLNPQGNLPIVYSSGAKVFKVNDYSTADGDFVISRSYRSLPFGRSASVQSSLVGLAGGWQLDFMYELQLASFSGSAATPNAKLALVSPDGTAFDFAMQSGGSFAPDTSTGAFYAPRNLKIEYLGTLPSDLSTLQSASTQWRVTDEDDTVWIFQTFTRPNSSSPFAVGRPLSRLTRDGYRWDFVYRGDGSLQTVTDSFGRQATFNWTQFYISSLASPPAGSLPYPEAVSSVSLPDGTSLRYTYDPPASTAAPSTSRVQRLVKVDRVDASSSIIDSTSYAYGDVRFPQYVTAITDMNGDQIGSYAYDSAGRAISSQLNGGAERYTVADSSTATELVRRVTNALGKTDDYHFQKFGTGSPDFRLTAVNGEASANAPASTTAITYGSDNFIATETDAEGHTTSYTRDSRGRPTTMVEAVGTPQAKTTTTTWDPTFSVPDRVVRDGLQTDYTYYPTGQLETLTQTDTTTQSVPYSTAEQTRTWTYAWGTGGRLASVNGPKPIDGQGKDDISSYSYDAAGNLQTVTNGLGQVTSFSGYDLSGRPAAMTNANNIVTAFTYDGLGRTKTVTVKHPTSSSLDATTSFEYDVHGRVTGVTLPQTDKLIIDYNKAGHVTDIRAASGERIDYETDADGNVVKETVKRADGTTSRQMTQAFDELGRTLKEALVPPNTSQFSYDKVGNPTQIKTPSGSATTQAFDALNRLASTVAPDGGTITRTYDASDNLTSHTDGISVQTQFVRNGFGEVIQEVSPDRGTSTYYYNAAGELTASIDGRGQRIDYTRDILGRVTQKVPADRPTSETIAYAWDTPGLSGSYGVGRLSSVTDGTGTTSFAYDHRGNVVVKRQTIGTGSADLAYAYDLADRVTQVTYPSGRLVQYVYDTKGRVSQIQTKASATAPSWIVLASGMTYEPFGSLTAMSLGNGLAVADDWGSDGQLASRRLYNAGSSANLSWLAYSYDPNGNIGAIRDVADDTNSVFYGYDSNDRLTLTSRQLATPPSAETYAYNSGTNRLATLTDAGGTRSITYDNRGNTLSEIRPGSISVSASYDGYARLLSYNRTGDPSQANTYNGMDDRVSVSSGSTTHEFVYDSDGRILGEYGTSASDVIAETIWLDPGVANDNQEFGGDDGVGGYAPLAMVSGSGSSAALNWVHGNNLGVPIVFTDASGTAVSPPGATLSGFPGQLKTLSDIYYNRYRDYDSSLGRYVQADPIGLQGGSNPFVYALNNPLRYSDPLGAVPNPLELTCLDPLQPVCWGGAGLDLITDMMAIYRGAILVQNVAQSAESDCPDGPKQNCRKASIPELRTLGINPHDLKYGYLGRGAKIARFDICICRMGSKKFLTLAPVNRCGKSRPEEHQFVQEI